jgi:hypothetical protein
MCAVELYWLPLGAGGWFVRLNGQIYESIVAAVARRRAQKLFHSALIVRLDGESFAIELGPETHGDHGRVSGGAVGWAPAGRLRLFRYETRCWKGGAIPDIDYAVGGPVVVSTDPEVAARIVDGVADAPTAVWGRDELRAGEMWNSNSVIAWLLARAGLDAAGLGPPGGGRAPGWGAGVIVAERET